MKRSRVGNQMRSYSSVPSERWGSPGIREQSAGAERWPDSRDTAGLDSAEFDDGWDGRWAWKRECQGCYSVLCLRQLSG